MTEREYQRSLQRLIQKTFGTSEDKPRSRSEMLRLSKQFLRLKDTRIRMRHRAGAEGVEICRMRSDVIDALVRVLWAYSVSNVSDVKLREKLVVSVCAHGGYGRRVMSPGSDLDLTFVFPGNAASIGPSEATLISEFLMFFWDLKLKVGHGARSVGESLRLASTDVETCTAFMELRFLAGDSAPFEELVQRFDKECIKGKEEALLKQRQEDLNARHAKYGNTPFVQEPNVKFGNGGMRDYQSLSWMCRVRLGTTNPKVLLDRGYISRQGWNELQRAYNFILRVRNEMHYTERRPEESLTLRLQGQVATHLGYRQKRILQRIEVFMRDYYTAARDILQRSSEMMDRFHLQSLDQKKPNPLNFMARRKVAKTEKFDGFFSRNERIFPEDLKIFQEDPHRMMRLFNHTQQRHLRLSPELFQLVQANFRLVTAPFRYNKTVRETFEGLLNRKGDVARVLRQMHRVGFLGKYIPEFGALTCLVQHEFFHHYTADEHTLRTIDSLDELSGAQAKGREFYQSLFREMQQPAILYLALLMHDAGRAANKRTHSDESVTLADAVARRMQIKGERRQLLLFLVDNHLLMYRTATTMNLEEPQVIEEFAQIIRTKDNLDALMLLTYADSRGTSDKSWSGYKESSVRQLYHLTREYLNAPADFMTRASVDLGAVRKALSEQMSASYADEIEAHVSHMPKAYFNFRATDSIVAHIRQFREFFRQLVNEEAAAGLMPVMHWEDHPEQSHSELTVACWDRRLLLARISGALAAENINILSADLYQRSDDLVLDVFHVCTTNFTAVTAKATRQRVEKAVREAFLKQTFDFSEAIAGRRKVQKGLDEMLAEVPQRAFLNNHISPVHTVLELQAVDRLGLLYDVLMAIGQLGHSVSHARINTEKGVALDSIYIRNSRGLKLERPAELAALQQQLDRVIFNAPAAAAS